MKKVKKIKGKLTLLLVVAISVLCVGLLISGCGSSSKMKVANPSEGAYAIDFSDCPIASSCSVVVESTSFDLDRYNIEAKEVTMEAWINPGTTAATSVVKRMGSRGVELSLNATSTPNSVIPEFTIMRVPVTGLSSTSTVEYSVESSSEITINSWYHIAGVLTNKDHNGVHTTCSGAESEAWHIDLYVDGSFKGCATTKGGTTSDAQTDLTADADAYADNPAANDLTAEFTGGVIDEARIWTVARTEAQIAECKGTELGKNSGTCGRINDSLIAYQRFNEGEGHTVTDFAGLGSGAKEFRESEGVFPEWNTGWVAGAPITAAD